MDAAIAQEIEDAAKEKAGGSRSRKRKGNQNGGTRRSRSSSRTSRSRSSSSKKGSKRGSAGSSSRSSSRSNSGGSGRRRRTKSSGSRGGLPRPHSHPQLKPSRRSLPPLLSKRARAASLRDAVAETYEDVSYFFGAIAFIARMIAKGTAVVGFQYIIVVYLARIFAYGLLLLNGFLKVCLSLSLSLSLSVSLSLSLPLPLISCSSHFPPPDGLLLLHVTGRHDAHFRSPSPPQPRPLLLRERAAPRGGGKAKARRHLLLRWCLDDRVQGASFAFSRFSLSLSLSLCSSFFLRRHLSPLTSPLPLPLLGVTTKGMGCSHRPGSLPARLRRRVP